MLNFRGPTQRIWILILMAILSPFILYYWHKNKIGAHSNFDRKNFSSNVTIKRLVRDTYEAGYRITNVGLCPNLGKDMKLLILVPSAMHNHAERKTIRQTWAIDGRAHNIRVGFVVGSSIKASQNLDILKEQYAYGDLIQTPMIDSFNNMTLKVVSMLEWVDTYCSLVPFIMRIDDHVYVNIPLLPAHLDKLRQAKRSIFGRIAHGWKTNRDDHSKYFLTKSDYKTETYPDFVLGTAYLITQDSIHDLYQTALGMPFMKMDDVFLTGMVAVRIGVRIIHMNEYSSGNSLIKDLRPF